MRSLAASVVLLAGVSRALSVEAFVTHTNFVEKTVTNVIEISVPVNRFVNEYHTNRVEHYRTNLVDVYATNWVRRTVTNRLVVDAWRTNFVDTYQTNVKTLALTNWETVVVTKTNWLNRNVTNVVAVDAWRTNMVEAYTTNRKTLNLTNWETVIVMRTNWVTHPVTNVVEIDLAAKGSATPVAASPTTEASVRLSTQTAPASGTKEGFVLEASRASHAGGDGRVEVQLRVKSGAESETAFQVIKWKVESDNGTILSFGQDQEFKKELPIGRYKVEARVQRGAATAVQVIRGTLDVTVRDAVIQQPLLGKN